MSSKGKGKQKEEPEDSGLNDNLPWVEKYRPSSLDDVSGHMDVIKTIRKFIESKKIPHLLFYGPPGTGKTSTIVAVAKEIFGPKYKSSVLELNASDDRGIDVVRDRIKSFASTRQMFSKGFKLIILDEADAMTNVAQNALRRIIEEYSANTRFCILANYTHKLTPALVSRCTRFRFSPLPVEAIRQRIDHVIRMEHVNIDEEGLNALLKLSKGDMRRALNVLQACNASVEEREPITASMVYDCVGSPLPSDVKLLLESILNDDWSTSLDTVSTLKQNKGLALADLLTEFTAEFQKLELKSKTRISLLDGLSEVEYRLSGGGSEKLQTSAAIGVVKKGMEIEGAMVIN